LTKRLLPFCALLAWCGALLVMRMQRSHSPSYVFLFWNLFLAAIPFGAALVLEALDKLRRMIALQWCCFAVWLVFLPNAPYIVTDFLHLRQRHAIPLWYDVLLLISCAGTGLILGYGSVMIVQRIVTRRYGWTAGWAVAILSLALSAFGIYLGRFLRFNSWEVLSDPLPLMSDIADRVMNPLAHPTTLAVTGLFGVALTLGYVALHAVAGER
jgi:uncharacterized membrane protein